MSHFMTLWWNTYKWAILLLQINLHLMCAQEITYPMQDTQWKWHHASECFLWCLELCLKCMLLVTIVFIFLVCVRHSKQLDYKCNTSCYIWWNTYQMSRNVTSPFPNKPSSICMHRKSRILWKIHNMNVTPCQWMPFVMFGMVLQKKCVYWHNVFLCLFCFVFSLCVTKFNTAFS